MNYWIRLVTGHGVFAHSCYNFLISFSDPAGLHRRYMYIKDILFRYGFGHVWTNQTVHDMKLFLEIVKVRLRDCPVQS